jgi:hypothetical protein
MSEKTIEFTRRLVEAFPALEEDYEIHVANNAGETLPHLFASMELMDAVVAARRLNGGRALSWLIRRPSPAAFRPWRCATP